MSTAIDLLMLAGVAWAAFDHHKTLRQLEREAKNRPPPPETDKWVRGWMDDVVKHERLLPSDTTLHITVTSYLTHPDLGRFKIIIQRADSE